MDLRKIIQPSSSDGQFNMTPIIDIVFLLIIFFMIVCQFIVAENFELDVPDNIARADIAELEDRQTTTVTVMKNSNRQIAYAVGAEIVNVTDTDDISEAIAAAIDRQLKELSTDQRVVNLRIDKDITYKHTQHALAGINLSTATDIKMAVLKTKRN
jgi:biopolymer transport protein ExbD